MTRAKYDGLADEYEAFADDHSPYYVRADEALRRMLGRGTGRCLDLGCGGGRYMPSIGDLGWTAVGVDESADQLRVARERDPAAELVQCDATDLPFPDSTFDAAISMFTHTDFIDFSDALRETLRVLKSGAQFVYIGNHPCFVGPTAEHVDTGLPKLHAGYRRGGRWSANAPGVTPDGWRARLGEFTHLPLGEFLSAFAGFVLVSVEELSDGWAYPKTIALATRKP